MTQTQDPHPPTIAVIGASSDRSKFGNKCVRAYLQAGYQVFPVNPREARIEGQKVYATVGEIPDDLDAASLYLPPPLTRKVLEELAAKGVSEVVYFNPGSADDEIVEEARRLGLPAQAACSIVAIGKTPSQFP
jgi:predicted CoA-binding protein